MKKNENNINKLQKEKTALEKDRDTAVKELKEKQSKVKDLNLQIKKKQEEQNKAREEFNKLVNLKQQINSYVPQSNIDIKAIQEKYEKQLAEKTVLINELLKKVKELTTELNAYKK